jgi:hypothetical protein
MITNQNIVVTSRGPITVRVHHDLRFFRAAVALLEGDGTREHSLHFVLLACHADMADEAPIATTERLTSALAEEVLACLSKKQSDIRDVLKASNVAAAATDRYYSILAGRVTQRNVIIGALGSVHGVVVKGSARSPVITPNVVRIGEHAVLDGVFGIGFREEAVSAKQFDLDHDATLLLIIGEEAAAADSIARHREAEAFIENVVRAARIYPPIVAVVR